MKTVTMKFEGVVFAMSKERERIDFRSEHGSEGGRTVKVQDAKRVRKREGRG